MHLNQRTDHPLRQGIIQTKPLPDLSISLISPQKARASNSLNARTGLRSAAVHVPRDFDGFPLFHAPVIDWTAPEVAPPSTNHAAPRHGRRRRQ